jgi:hypothetical protein
MTGQAIYSVRSAPFYDSREKFEASAQSYFSDPPQLKRYAAMLSKVNFSRKGGMIQNPALQDRATSGI